jgi:tRNA1Val (adenine37-N6)-methyltransferase
MVIASNILNFKPEKKFHHIFCNPPFYERQLVSPNKEKNVAHHANSLTMDKLLTIIKKWLLPTGTASLLIPYYRENEVIQLINGQNLVPSSIIRVKQTPSHQPFRSILILCQNKQECFKAELTIKDKENQYTEEFTRLLKPFYLNL